MHIKFFSSLNWAPWGGSEILWSRTAEWLAARGVRVSASVQGWPTTPDAVTNLRKCGVNVWERGALLPTRTERLLRKLKFRRYVDTEERMVRAWLEDGQPDLVCFSDGPVAWQPRYLRFCGEAGIPYVNVAQGNSESLWPTDALADEQIHVLDAALRCFFVSEANWKLCELQLGHRLQNAEVVRNPFAVDYGTVASWPSCLNHELELACVARLEPAGKGQDLLFQVLAMPKWRSRSVHVDLYGGGHMERSVRRMASMLDVDHAVSFAGQVADIERVWRQHHALILPSRAEGLPLALVEAMLCHRTVITTKVAGAPEVVEDGRSGFLADVPTIEALDSALERAWSRRSEFREIGLYAGESIRRIVPRDPVKVFAEKLLVLADQAKPEHRSSR